MAGSQPQGKLSMAAGSADILSFVPIDRRLALARGDTLPDRASGAALIADIAGFTPLAEGLASALGPRRGAEVLTGHLDAVYGTLIDQIELFGGSVVSFGGDAITCWFDGDSGRRAVAAALAMQAALRDLAPISVADGPLIHLAAKIGVTHGPVRRFVVGDPRSYRMDVLAGRTLTTVSGLLASAAPGDVLLDAATARHLSADITVVARTVSHLSEPARVVTALTRPVDPSPWAATPTPFLSNEAARAWLLPAVHERLQLSQGEFLADLRPAVALFVGFAGLDYDGDDDAGLLLDAYLRSVQSVLARFDGALINLTIGDKGSYCLGVLGVPTAHDDDAARGIAATLELRRPPPQLNFVRDIRIGLAYGLMYAGAYGCSRRRTYGVQGDKTNLAARLMENTPSGEIVCDDEVYRQARRRWAFDALPALRVKGKAGLIRVYRPTGAPASAAGNDDGDEQRLVGRAPELAQLETALSGLQSGQGGLLTMEGEAGLGKSRLVNALAQLARERGLTGLIGAGQSVEQQTAYRAWHDILFSFFDLEAVSDLDDRRARVLQAGQELIPRLLARLPLLNDILALGLPETPLTAALDPALRQESLTSLVVSLLRAWVRERPLILVLEDAQWVDSLSWQLTRQVYRALLVDRLPLLLMLVTRELESGSEAAQFVAAISGLAPVTRLALRPLASGDLLALAALRLALAPEALPEPVATLLQERAGGNPLFAEEMAYALRDRGLIRIEADTVGQGVRCVVGAELLAMRAVLPDTLQGLILSRIDQLPPQQQFTLKVAAVIGRRFTYSVLHNTVQHFDAAAEANLPGQVEAFARDGLITLENAEPEATYQFKQAIIQEVAYQTLLFGQRRQIHQVVAEWYRSQWALEQTAQPMTSQPDTSGTGPSGALLPLLAYHYRAAESLADERYFARLAGQQAARQHANMEALQYFSRALELTSETDHESRFALRLDRESIYELLGAREAQVQELAELEQVTTRLGVKQQAIVLLRQANFHYQTGDYAAVGSAARHAVMFGTEASEAAIEARGYLEWSMALWQQANYAEAQARNDQALAIARRAELKEVEAECLRQQGILFDAQANYPAARAALSAALDLHQRAADKRGEAKCLNSLGVIAYNQEDHLAATGYYQRSLAIKQEIGDRYGQGITLQNLGIVAHDRGELEAARAYFEQALSLCREIGDREGEASAFDGLGMAALRLGDYPRAEADILRALELSREIGDRVNQSTGLTNLSTLRHALGDHAA
jgi:class 3 adenylate cyclase/predicted ATPase